MVFWRRAPAKKVGKVVLFGATSPVGQPLSLLLKLCPHVREIVCCSTTLDNARLPAVGVAADLSHVDTDTSVRYGMDPSDWPAALHDASLVLVCSGDCFDPLRADRDVALRASAPAVQPAMRAYAASGSTAAIAVVSSPVNALVPYCAELLKREGKFDPRKLFGVTTLDVTRVRQLVAGALGKNPYDVNVPVVGGRGGVTACPLIAQTGLRVATEDIMRITQEIQQYGAPFDPGYDDEAEATSLTTEVAPPVCLGLAQAACDFAVSVLKAQRGDYGIVECAYVESTMRSETPFFSSRVRLGVNGVEEIFPMGSLTMFEHDTIEVAVPEIAKDVEAGLAFLRDGSASTAKR